MIREIRESKCPKWTQSKGKSNSVTYHYLLVSYGGSVVKNPPANAGNTDSIPDLGRFPGEGNGNPPQYSCLGNPMDRGAWQAIAHSVAKSQIQLSSQACTQEKKQATYKPKDLNILKDYPFPGRNWLQVLLLPTITQSLPHIRFHPHQHTMIAS